ncbi:unnamed protein product [Mycena citricolor]|uniref:Peroxidase n=1 Tax=Mycena citricolor TaxID=2018698 RepID=A0AAD2Q1F5_9AGAR|nr:unnamed protein product [Mycena citricolor]
MSLSLLRASAPRIAARAPSARPVAPRVPRVAYRHYSTEFPKAPKWSASTGLKAGVAAATILGGGFFFLPSSSDLETRVKSTIQVAKVAANLAPTQEEYQKVYNKIAALLDEADDHDDGSYGPLILRLAWHSSGTYDKNTKTGGSNFATMRFKPESDHGANTGLQLARDLMETVRTEFPWITYGDLWTLAGVAAIQEMAGPRVPWRAGRIDGSCDDVTKDERLPSPFKDAAHLRNIFHRMGFNDQEIVALSGAHAIGRCHPPISGMDGPWTFSPTTLTNDYFRVLFSERWVKKAGHDHQFEDKSTRSLLMMPTDLVLLSDKTFKKFAKAYADDNDLFFKDFSAVVSKLFELGVPPAQWVSPKPWTMKTLDEQKA